jgi:opacity protein-like surface antigen
MTVLRGFSTIAVACLLIGPALADPGQADPPSVSEMPQPTKPAVSGSWYLRGDIGYVVTKPDVEAPAGVPYLQGVDWEQLNLIWGTSNTNLGTINSRHGWDGGFGVGYDFGMMRVDLTADNVFGAGFSAHRIGSNDTDGNYRCEYGGHCSGKDEGTFQQLTLMANLYADLGTWGGFTPYLGAGVGAAYRNWDLTSSQACSTPSVGSCEPEYEGVGNNVTWKQNTSGEWSPAWALMAGFSVDFTENWAVDVGYRYVGITGGDSSRPYNGLNQQRTGTFTLKDSSSQEFRAGLRYIFGSAQ